MLENKVIVEPILPDTEEDYASDEYNEDDNKNTIEWGEDATKIKCEENDDCRPSLRDGSIRLTGGRDEAEVKWVALEQT